MLWLVTPVHGRYALTRICFEQRAAMLAELAALGVEARQLVVGEDRNLDTAREFGFETLKARNSVGLRVNDGFEWACREGGASHVAYCGSDDWHLASYFADLPAKGTVKTSRWQAFVSPLGDRLVVLRNTAHCGGAPWVIPRGVVRNCHYRPADDEKSRAVDASIAKSMTPRVRWNERRRYAVDFVFNDEATDQLRMVDFKAGGEQITPWGRVVRRGPRPVLDSGKPFELLATRYPAALVERIQKFYATKEAR